MKQQLAAPMVENRTVEERKRIYDSKKIMEEIREDVHAIKEPNSVVGIETLET